MDRLKVIIIDVGASEGSKVVMNLISSMGGENVDYFSVKNADIDKIFNRITVSLGLIKKQTIAGIVGEEGAVIAVQ